MAFFGWDKLKNLTKTDKKQIQPSEYGTGVAMKCKKCGEIIIKTTLHENLGVCPSCHYHTQISADRRIAITLDEGSFIEHDEGLMSKDILEFSGGGKGYKEKLDAEINKTGMLSAIKSGEGKIGKRRVAFAVTDSAFIAGSMGSVVGEKITRLIEFAIEERLPVIIVSGSGGGARMHEGLYSLMQMAKTSAALGKLKEAGLPFLSIVTDSTMGGVWASWAALGDIIIGEPGALVGFTGPRVIKSTINAELPDGFQITEFLLKHGQIDMIVDRHDLRGKLISIMNLLLGAVA